MQTILDAFNSSKEKKCFKIVFRDSGLKRVIFEQAFSQKELEVKYPAASQICAVREGLSQNRSCGMPRNRKL